MKILFANGRITPPFSVGGDGISMTILLEYLTTKKFQCSSLGIFDFNKYFHWSYNDILKKISDLKINYKIQNNYQINQTDFRSFPKLISFNKRIIYYYKYPCLLVKNDFFNYELINLINNYQPNLIFTQLEKAPEVINIAYRFHIPSILFIRGTGLTNLSSLKLANKKCSAVIFNSNFTQNHFKKYLKIPSFVFYPPLDQQVLKISDCHQKYITMINPIKEKGRDIFLRVAASLPQYKFLAVENWSINNKKNNLEKFVNITFLPKQDNIRKIFQQTKLLLVPSIWIEAFGRVAIEAQSNGIPVISSNRGGLPEAVGDGGIIINEISNISNWTKAINFLINNKKEYNNLSQKALNHAKQFDINKTGDQFIKKIQILLKKNNLSKKSRFYC